MKKSLIIFIITIALIAVTFFVYKGTTEEVIKEEKVIQISLSEISEQARWYEYKSENTHIKYFAVKASDGSIKTAFDACDVCFRSKNGYSQDGDFMVCNNCGNRYPISGLGTENKAGGGCWPGYLPSKVEGENLMIKQSDLEKGGYGFK